MDMDRPKEHPENSISIALGRLRGGTHLACWLLGLALLVHVVVWAMTSYTDLRYANSSAAEGAPKVVVQPELTLSEAADAQTPVVTEPAPRHVGKSDRAFRAAASVSGGLGTLAMILLVPLLGLGVTVAAGSATPGVEHTVSAFAWSLILGVLVLPVGVMMGTLPNWSSFTSYDALIAQVEAYRQGAADAPGFVAFYGRFLLIPLTAIVGCILIGVRFSAGVEAARMPREPILDPVLEAEAANIATTSLHGSGGRTAGALRKIGNESEPVVNEPVFDDLPDATKVSVGSKPNRVI